jgi:hypothetical protein
LLFDFEVVEWDEWDPLLCELAEAGAVNEQAIVTIASSRASVRSMVDPPHTVDGR